MGNRGRLTGVVLCLVGLMAIVAVPAGSSLLGQDKSKSSKKSGKARKGVQVNTKSLDLKADQIQASFARDAEELAGQYVEAGHLDKAKALLEAVLAVNPQLTNIQKKLEQLREGILNSNDYDFDINPSQSWQSTGAMVMDGKAMRIKAEGTYRFEAAASGVTATGFPDKDPGNDFVPGIPCGALMGVIVGQDKSSKPFLVGESLDLTPKETGILMLRINAPVGHNKNSGRLKISISGHVQTK